MTATQRPDPGTAVQMIESVAIGTLPAAVQQQLELRKLSNQIAGKLAEMNWGQKLDLATRRAVADWGRQFRVDVTTEIHVLGNNVYLNAAFYLRRLGELIAEGLVEYAFADHVEDDPRLKDLGPEGEGEYSRRLHARIMHAIPDKAASAVVFRVKLRAMEREIVGVKWCGNGTRKSDPVGDSFPVESSESRAARRAMRLLVSHVPKRIEQEILAIEDGAEALSERVDHARKEIKARNAEIDTPTQMIAAPKDAADPYGVASEAGEASSPLRVASVTAPTPVSAPAATPPASDRPATGAGAFKLPYGMGSASVGTMLRDVTTADLKDALNFAQRDGRYVEFVEAASIELDDRTNGPGLGV